MTADDSTDAGGPMVGVCHGHRCAALWRLRDGSGDGAPDRGDDPCVTGGVAALRSAVRDTRGAVLTSLGCVGACAQGAMVGVADRRPGSTRTGQVAWVVGADAADRLADVLAWIGADWSAGAPPPPPGLHGALCRMVRVDAEASASPPGRRR